MVSSLWSLFSQVTSIPELYHSLILSLGFRLIVLRIVHSWLVCLSFSLSLNVMNTNYFKYKMKFISLFILLVHTFWKYFFSVVRYMCWNTWKIQGGQNRFVTLVMTLITNFVYCQIFPLFAEYVYLCNITSWLLSSLNYICIILWLKRYDEGNWLVAENLLPYVFIIWFQCIDPICYANRLSSAILVIVHTYNATH